MVMNPYLNDTKAFPPSKKYTNYVLVEHSLVSLTFLIFKAGKQNKGKGAALISALSSPNIPQLQHRAPFQPLNYSVSLHVAVLCWRNVSHLLRKIIFFMNWPCSSFDLPTNHPGHTIYLKIWHTIWIIIKPPIHYLWIWCLHRHILLDGKDR